VPWPRSPDDTLLDQCRSDIIMVFVAPLLVPLDALLSPLGLRVLLPEDVVVVDAPFNYKYYWKGKGERERDMALGGRREWKVELVMW
jgi:hypothetical protein